MLTPRSLWFPVKCFVQRGRRGWSDRDLWSLDKHLERILAGSLVKLADTCHGHPCLEEGDDLMRFVCRGGEDPCMCGHKWSVELYRNAELFNRLHRDEFWDFNEEDTTRTEATSWLAKRWGALWD